ncbi:fungal-specific transcription factor domain-containing protein [Trichoderma sp. SZMC 28014]
MESSIYPLFASNTRRSFSGCWTCRLRRKKCDEQRPICQACASLQIDCYSDNNKPAWMDGGRRQERMLQNMKARIKETAAHRRWNHMPRGKDISLQPTSSMEFDPTTLDASIATPNQLTRLLNHHVEQNDQASSGLCALRQLSGVVQQSHDWLQRPDMFLVTYYYEHLLPFLYPFYSPPITEGGKFWVLDMILSSPVVRQSALCQSAYWFSQVTGSAGEQRRVEDNATVPIYDALRVLGHALSIINASFVSQHLNGSTRILTAIIQLQRFEAAQQHFDGYQMHLTAAATLFEEILESCRNSDRREANPLADWNAAFHCLGPPSWSAHEVGIHVPSAEQAAFQFSTSILLMDDIILSTVLSKQPRLYDYHLSLLGTTPEEAPSAIMVLDLEGAVGCHNWVLLQIGRIATLDSWKKRRKEAENLNVMELARQAEVIRDALNTKLLETSETLSLYANRDNDTGQCVAAIRGFRKPAHCLPSDACIATQIWSHAAIIYLSVVVSGWQPYNALVRHSVQSMVRLLTCDLSSSSRGLLRSMAWPLFVAGCMADNAQELCFRALMSDPVLKSSTAIQEALLTMESIWKIRDTDKNSLQDFSSCFNYRGYPLCLV